MISASCASAGQQAPKLSPFAAAVHSSNDIRVGVADDGRSPTAHQVDIPVSVHVIDVGTFGPFDEDGVPTDGMKGTDRAVHAAH